ncbi:cilia- and flagella-associated protein 221 [Gadus chalcogrammus]|uniref:cilia- and flagella-associated protein 221 n=1 Tax=Gadus chalcogrammus TaxID=1042646 RepID=UPI0024C24107|nr:cilia- and flagella-associated protein 221 [Gadus chalcogrammus]
MAVTHLSFPALRQGSPVPLGQLVEESRTPRASNAPHHLLTSEIYSPMKSNSQIQAEPAALHFNGFSLGKGYQKVLKLINISSEVINIHIITTQTKYFRTTYTKKYRLIPGLAYTVKVHFCPDQWRYFYDCLLIHCKGEEALLIPVHAYPVIDDLCIPPHIHLPSIPLGHSVSHSLPLRCSCPADLEVEFQVHVIQPHQAFQVQPLAGSIPASGEVVITVTFRPLEYGTSQVTIQLVISQFNSKPFLCTLIGSSALHLPTSSHEGEMACEAMLAADYRTRVMAPVIRNHAVLQVPPVLQIKRTASKKADKLKAAVQPPSPTNVCTPAGVAKMLIKDGDRVQSRDLREVMSCDSIVGLRSRQLKEALFMKKVRGDVTEERANRLRWQQHLGKTPVSEKSRGQILEEREITVHQYTIQWDSGHQEENVFVWGRPRLSTKRVLRDVRQAVVGAPCFTFYCGPELLVSLRALRLFQQAARKVVIRCRMNHRLACLRKTKKPSRKNQEHVKGNKKAEGLISPDKIFPLSFPVCVNMAGHLSLSDLTTVAVGLVDTSMATHVPLFQLQVPHHFKVMGYSPPLSWEAFNSYVPPTLTRPLRSGALAVVGAPCFTFYCGPELLVSLRALRLFQQAARKVVIRCRMNHRLACLRKTKKPSRKNQEHVKGNKKAEGLISPDKIFPLSFPVCVNMAGHLSLSDLTTVAVGLVDTSMATHVPLFQLQVPHHFKVMGYSPPLSWEAFNSYVPPTLTRPLRSGALDKLLPELLKAQQATGSVRREGPGEAEDQEEELRGGGDRVAEAILQPGPAQPTRIFNPAPDRQIYKPIPQYLETSAELHLCPLPRFTDNRSKKNYLDLKEVIKGVMTWKTSDWTTLRRLSELPTCSTMAERMAGSSVRLRIAVARGAHRDWASRGLFTGVAMVSGLVFQRFNRSLDLKTDMFPERVPPPLIGPSDDIDPTLVDRLTEEPGVCLTQEMIRAEFLGDEEVGDRT